MDQWNGHAWARGCLPLKVDRASASLAYSLSVFSDFTDSRILSVTLIPVSLEVRVSKTGNDIDWTATGSLFEGCILKGIRQFLFWWCIWKEKAKSVKGEKRRSRLSL